MYQKTALPAKLDLTKYNTREQLKAEQDPRKANRGGTGKETVAVASQQDCTDVMRKDLRDWLVKHDINGAPPSAVAEQKAMWAWIRDFHQEYSDDWFSRNMPRLHEQFKPIFVSEMKAMKGTTKTVEKPVDMLDFDTPSTNASASSSSKPAVGGIDLLDISEPSVAPASTNPVAVSQDNLLIDTSVTTQAPAAYTPDLSNSLLSLDLGGSSAVPSSGPNLTTPALVTSNDLLAGGLDFGSTVVTSQPPQQCAPVSASSDLGLIDFGAPSLAPTPQATMPTAVNSSGYAATNTPSASVSPIAQLDALSQAALISSTKATEPTTNSSSKELNLLDLL